MTAPRTPGSLSKQSGAKKKVIRDKAHLSYRRLCPNKHIIANISAELREEYPGDWLCIHTPLLKREQGRLPWEQGSLNVSGGGGAGGDERTTSTAACKLPELCPRPLNFPRLFRSDGSLRPRVIRRRWRETDVGAVQRPPSRLCFSLSAAATVARFDCDWW